mmetsp:Transcript_3206/g.7209  ORF Transcript_3206/g.7209 Transcript_3206/m.7209 type:complete len:96 (+) Transcript_3206:636-923(+)
MVCLGTSSGIEEYMRATNASLHLSERTSAVPCANSWRTEVAEIPLLPVINGLELVLHGRFGLLGGKDSCATWNSYPYCCSADNIAMPSENERIFR